MSCSALLFTTSCPLPESLLTTSSLSSRTNLLRHQVRPAKRPLDTQNALCMSGRSAWPIGRFVSDAFFFTPIGRILRGSASPPKPMSQPRTSTTDPVAGAKGNGWIFVSGASGNTGRRVIRELLSSQRRVAALTRTRARLVSALASVDIDAAQAEKDGLLRIIVSDLYNVPEEALFGVTGVISAVGTKIGPQDDDVERSKYTQGLKFFPPVVLEDTPQNVEYNGVSRLVSLVRSEFATAKGVRCADSLFDFSDKEAMRKTWGTLDDVVMGGVSSSNTREQNGCLMFYGTVSTNNSGGFVSTRTADFSSDVDLSSYDGVQLRVRGDGQRYKFILRCERKWDGRAYCVSFDTEADKWIAVNFPFSDFQAVFRGKTVSDAPPLDATRIAACQVMLSKFEYDGDLNPKFTAGAFSIAIGSVCPYVNVKDENRKHAPRYVHLSSAAVTRPLRTNESGKQFEIPIVQLNAKIGNALNWKFAGEDAIREAGAKKKEDALGYVIVRPTALTVEEPVGIDRLIFDQGDNVIGKVSRDDVAKLLQVALDEPAFLRKTFEVISADKDSSLKSAVERVQALKEDEDMKRVISSFPYVPEALTGDKEARSGSTE